MRKYNLLFDGSILINEFNKNDARSGIFFASKNIFHHMLKRDDINVSLYCDTNKCTPLQVYLKKYKLDKEIEIFNIDQNSWFYKTQNTVRNLKCSCDKHKHPINRAITNILYAAVSGLGHFYSNTCVPKNKLKQKLIDKNIDFFYSPITKTPNFVREAKQVLSTVYLYDAIPFIFPEYYPKVFSGKYWICDLVNSFNDDEIYFSDSQSAKDDFLKQTNKLSDEQITVAYLATSDAFTPINDEQKLTEAKEKYNIPQDKKYIFSLCTLEPRKNLVRAVKTFIQFIEKNKIDDLVFVLGGGHWEAFIDKLESEIKNLGDFRDKIVRAGYIDDEDLPVLYSGAEWFVFTSRYEGFGLPPLEAMSCGCPVISSNISSIPEVVGDAALKIDWDSDEQHIQAYEQYYFNENLRRENSQKGLDRAKEFSWDKCVDIIITKLIETKEKKENKGE